jgi:hypothetical protein
VHSDFELRDYQRHDYQKSWRVAGGGGRERPLQTRRVSKGLRRQGTPVQRC